MKKKAIIITCGLLVAVAVALFWQYRSSNIPEHSKRPPILFPPQGDWPPDVITATTEFKELNGKWREAQQHTIVRFAERCRHKWNIETDEDKLVPLTKKDILTLLGPPDSESDHQYYYQTARTGCSVSFLDIYFNMDKVCLIGFSVGLTSNATEDELMVPPDDNETEQGGPGYPPQGVGSPDP